MKTIYKYPLAVTDEQTVVAPGGARWLSVDNQLEALYAWAVVERDDPDALNVYHFRIVGTGNQAEDLDGWHHLGTVQQFGGQLVWHVFIKEDD